MRQRFTALVALVVLAVGVASRAENPAAAAAELWKHRCAVCHGPDGRGATHTGRSFGIPDLTSSTWQASRTDGQIRSTILEGTEHMPGYAGKLSRGDVDALVKHVRSLGKPTASR